MVTNKHVNRITSFVLGTTAAFLCVTGLSPVTALAQDDNYTTPPPECATSNVEIIWDDCDNQDGIRPDSLNVFLAVDGESVDIAALSEENGWSCSFGERPVFNDDGTQRVFTVGIEDAPADCGYAFSEPSLTFSEGYHFTITASHETAKQELSARIAWIDDSNADGVRPNAVTFSLYADGEYTDSRTVTAVDSAGIYSGELPSSSGDTVITGSAESDAVKANADSYGQYLTNGQDSWEASFGELPVNRGGAPITYHIQADGIEGYDVKTVFAKEFGYSFPGTFFAAVHEPAPKTNVTVSMIWNDSDNLDLIRPASVHASLIADGTTEVSNFDLSEAGEWSHTEENIDSVNADGSMKNFSLTTEDAPEGYTYSVERSDTGNGPAFIITGTHEHTSDPDVIPDDSVQPAKKISVTVSMVWNDSDNLDGIRPALVRASLIADGIGEVAGFHLNEGSRWSSTAEGIYSENDDGSPRSLSLLTDDAPEGYAYSVEKSETEEGLSFTVTGTHIHKDEPEPPVQVVSVTAGIAWDDSDNIDRIRPEIVHARLIADGTTEAASFDFLEDNAWTAAADNIISVNADGSKRDFSLVIDNAPEGYTFSEKKTSSEGRLTFTLIGKHEHAEDPSPRQVKITLSGMVIWDDCNDQDKIRPDHVTVYLEGGGQTFNMTASQSAGWKYTFTDIPKYDDKGTVIPYQVSAKAVDGYTTTTAGYNLVNTHEPKKTSDSSQEKDSTRNPDSSNGAGTDGNSGQSPDNTTSVPDKSGSANTININGRKVWDDQNDADRIRPSSITIRLFADGSQVKSATVTSDTNWVYTFQGMPKYASDGKRIKYTIDEDSVSGYTKTVNGYTVINTHLPSGSGNNTGKDRTTSTGGSQSGTININGTKTWVDNNNSGKLRPDYIVVHLYADGTEKRVTTVTEGNGWVYSFAGMPKNNESGQEIKYTIDEDDVKGYKKTVTGYNIVNTLSTLTGSDEEKAAIEEASRKESSVPTGDQTPVAIMIAILVIAAAAITGCIIKARKTGKKH